MFKKIYPRLLESVADVMQDIEQELNRLKLPRKNITRTLLLTEESVVSFLENVSEKSRRIWRSASEDGLERYPSASA